MYKYWQIFSVSLSEMFTYKISFVLWRFRVVISLLLVYFLWSTVFLNQDEAFGYKRTEIITYILLVAFLRSFILSSRTQDIAGEIRDGELTNYLLRPASYFGWWISRDAADKFVNVMFSIVEISILIFLLKPPLVFQVSFPLIILTILVGILATVLYFNLSLLVSLSAFWLSDVWAIRFLTFISIDFLAGGYFPLDILPENIFRIIQLTPFPYILFFPAKIYLGQLGIAQILFGFSILLFWITFLFFITRLVFLKGLKIYGAEGR